MNVSFLNEKDTRSINKLKIYLDNEDGFFSISIQKDFAKISRSFQPAQLKIHSCDRLERFF